MAVVIPGSAIRPSLQALAAASFAITYDTASGAYDVPLPPGALVLDVQWQVTEGFTTSGSNAALTIGDAAAADGYAKAADTALETLDTVAAKASGAGEAYATGKYYPTGGVVRLTFTKASAGATAGKIVGAVLFTCVTNGGIDAAAAG